jgi:hypothetical protein
MAVPPLSIEELLGEADLVVSGRVTAVQVSNMTSEDQEYIDARYRVSLAVYEIDKGTVPDGGKRIDFHGWRAMDRPFGWAGGGGTIKQEPQEGQKVQVYLKREPSGWTLFSDSGFKVLSSYDKVRAGGAAKLVVEIRSAIERLTTLGQPDVDAISVAVGTPLTRTNPDASPTDPMRYFEGTFEEGPFRAVDLRMNIRDGSIFLVLPVRKDCVIHDDEIAPGTDGTLRGGNVNPDIPPEGQVAYYYETAGLRLAFSFTASSRRLTSVSIEWPKRTPLRNIPKA